MEKKVGMLGGGGFKRGGVGGGGVGEWFKVIHSNNPILFRIVFSLAITDGTLSLSSMLNISY